MPIPPDLKYTETHQWIRIGNDEVATVGITAHAQELLGDLIFVENPSVGRELKKGEQCGVVESVKSASDIYAPVSGEVTAVNGDLATTPEKINEDAYQAWLFKLRLSDKSEITLLLNADDYQRLIDLDPH